MIVAAGSLQGPQRAAPLNNINASVILAVALSFETAAFGALPGMRIMDWRELGRSFLAGSARRQPECKH